MTEKSRVVASLQERSEGFMEVFDRLEGVTREDDVRRLSDREIDHLLGTEESQQRSRLRSDD